MRTQRIAVFAAMAAAALVAAGCRVETEKHGDSDNVKVSTPFGGVQVKTNDAVTVDSMGLPAYPGAQMVKKDDDKNDGAADVNVGFGSFRLRVKAVSYTTNDSPDKVEAFYRNGLKRFGDVIACRDNRVVGSPARTMEGLTCDSDQKGHIHVNDDAKGDLELKAGSQQHQHIVSIEREGGGTKFGLVLLDLPKSGGDENDDNRQ